MTDKQIFRIAYDFHQAHKAALQGAHDETEADTLWDNIIDDLERLNPARNVFLNALLVDCINELEREWLTRYSKCTELQQSP